MRRPRSGNLLPQPELSAATRSTTRDCGPDQCAARRYASRMPADGKALYAAAQAFRELAPWKWMRASELFGVRDPRTGMIGWCSIMGAGEECSGLSVHRGDRGFDLQSRRYLESDSI